MSDHNGAISEILGESSLRGERGLSSAQVIEKRGIYGFNEIHQPSSQNWLRVFVGQFQSPLVLLLIFACILSVFMGEWVEAVAISGILFLNALIGFIQEYRAETAIAALQTLTAPRARVIRDGRQNMVPAREVVPGDLLLLEAGDVVAADGEIFTSSQLQINEALLTGESVPVEKRASSKFNDQNLTLGEKVSEVFMGTVVVAGTARVQVQSTGMRTELGKMAHLMSAAEISLTPLQIQLQKVGKMLLLLCLLIVTVVSLHGLYQGRSGWDLLLLAISLAVAAVPEGLPAIVTVALATGVRRMAAQQALIRKLPSVEALGSVSIICTDKTGTLTTGHMRVRELWSDDEELLLYVAASCCDTELTEGNGDGIGDPTEMAILLAARERFLEKEVIEKENPRLETRPFDFAKKRMAVFRRDQKLYVKGAFEKIRPLCSEAENRLIQAELVQQDMTSRGLRVLAVAQGNGPQESHLKLIGLIGIADPPRPEVMASLREAREAGIEVRMLTGDHRATAESVARELGLVLEDERVEDRVHARVTPEEKLKLVRQLKSTGAIVAMTGDGVNDAPALREAHVGIAMGKSGTEVTRQAADLVLADDNFATIISAVKEGRAVYLNIRKAIIYLLVGNFAELMTVFGCSVLGLSSPFLAVHLLWINLVTDGLPALTLIADSVSPDIMKSPPRNPDEPILGLKEWLNIVSFGTIEALVSLSLFAYILSRDGLDHARSLVFTTLVLSQIFRSFSARSRDRNFWQLKTAFNLWLWGVVVFTSLLQWSLHYFSLTQKIFGLVPLSLTEWLWVTGLALIPLLAMECYKLVKRNWLRRIEPR